MKHLKSFGINRKAYGFVLVLILLLPLVIKAQSNTNNTGLILDDEKYEQFDILIAGVSKEEAPPKSMSLKSYTPYPNSQGSSASCVGWAVGYGAVTIQTAIQQGVTQRDKIHQSLAFSPSYIYNQIKSKNDCRSGASLADAMALITKQGVCLKRTFDVSDCSILPDYKARQEASQFNKSIALKPARLFTLNASGQVKIEKVKSQLAAYKPVIIGFGTTPEFRSLNGVERWRPDGQINQLGHAMVVVGYNDNDQTFELMNSFGINWGIGGFIKIGYTDFAKYARHAFVLQERDGAKNGPILTDRQIPMQTEIKILQNSRLERTNFKEVAVMFNQEEQHYLSANDGGIHAEGLIRMSVALPAGRHLYVINKDDQGNVSLLKKVRDYYIDSLVTFPDRGGFRIRKGDEEQFYFILSYRDIPDIESLIQRLSGNTNSLKEGINRIFKAKTIYQEETLYSKDKMLIHGMIPSHKDGIAVAAFLILKVPNI